MNVEKQHKAFTTIELLFVLVVIGIIIGSALSSGIIDGGCR